MFKFRQLVGIFALILVLSLAMAACGDEKAGGGINTYSGASSVTVPDSFKQSASQDKTVKDVKVDACKTGDSIEKVKTYYADQYKKDGWTVKKDGSDVSSNGAVTLGFEKDKKQVAVVIVSGSVASTLGVKDVGEKDTFFMVASAEKV